MQCDAILLVCLAAIRFYGIKYSFCNMSEKSDFAKMGLTIPGIRDRVYVSNNEISNFIFTLGKQNNG